MSSGLEEFGIVDDEPGGSGPVVPAAEPQGGPEPAKSDLDAIASALQKVYLFSGLLPAHIERISKLAQELHYKKNDVVFRHGDEGDGLYVVLEGAIRISRDVSGMGEEALAVLKDGTHFGEMSLIDDDVPRSADALCHDATRLLKISKHDLRDLMFVDRELAYELLWRFVRGLSGRLRDSNDRLMMLTASSKF